MAKLSEITKGVRVRGIAGDAAVTIRDAEWHGDSVLNVTYKTDQGALGEAMLYDFDEESYVVEESRAWGFDADDLRLVSEAYRIGLAHLFDPYLAIRTSAIEPLPHQISAVYQEMLPRLPLRYVLADDPGAGKTIMTGLLVKEMMARGDLKRCLIVAPGNLVEQWQDELWCKFGLKFAILTNEVLESSATGNAFDEVDLCIGRLDKLARNDEVQKKLRATSWDLVVCDEAHKMSATNFGNEPKYTKRYRLGQLLGDTTENLLLLTATPHNGKPADFRYFMALVDKDRFAGGNRIKNPAARAGSDAGQRLAGTALPDCDVSDVMRRLVKEELLKFDGRPLFPERLAYTVEYDLSPAEKELYDLVTQYVTEEFNRAERLGGKHRNSVGFALTILQRRLASSPEAIYQSLRRRRVRLESKLAEAKSSAGGRVAYSDRWNVDAEDFDEDDYGTDEYEQMEDDVVDTASTAATAAELEVEITTLRTLERKANDVRISGEDRKWEELSRLLQDDSNMFGADGRREKLIIFTEHKDTLNYLAGKIGSLLGDAGAVLTIKGGMTRDERHRAEEAFKQDANVRILVATDAAGEGINLQRAHLMINYDLPWNPNRLEQRFGRIHRIGQTEVCHLWNLVSTQTREGEVFQRLFSKLEVERAALGGKVFDILGRVTFEGKTLRDLLLDAIRYGDDPEVRARLNQVVDASLDTAAIKDLLKEYALTSDVMDVTSVNAIREDMERIEARKLEPHFIQAFFMAAMKRLGGRVEAREPGRFEVLEVPFSVRSMDMGAKNGCVLPAYERICFDKASKEGPGLVPAELVCPGEPLLDGIVKVLVGQLGHALKQGCVLVDDMDPGREPRLLLYIEDSVLDGTALADGTNRTVSKEFRFVEVSAAGEARNAGYAPYLDYRGPRPSEATAARMVADSQTWLAGDIEKRAVDYAIREIVPAHLTEVRERRLPQIEKVVRAVDARLTDEANYWDGRAWELEEKERQGKKTRLSSINARRRADELRDRRQVRLAQLGREKAMRPALPRVLGGALVVPAGMLAGDAVPDGSTIAGRREVELAGMRAVMAIERGLGFKPRDRSADNCGYDIESAVPEALHGGECALRMIEVKGRAAGSTTVTVSHNEVMCALNRPDSFILALVEVDGDVTRTTYIKRPFTNPPDYTVASTNYDIARLKEAGDVILEREQKWQ
ncbi:helicase-related protein [Lancefieldella rimae]